MIATTSIYHGITSLLLASSLDEANAALAAGDVLLCAFMTGTPDRYPSFILGRKVAASGDFDTLEAELRASKDASAKSSLQAIVYLRRRVKDLEDEAEMLASTAMDANERVAAMLRSEIAKTS
jgi:hypothetical protein